MAVSMEAWWALPHPTIISSRICSCWGVFFSCLVLGFILNYSLTSFMYKVVFETKGCSGGALRHFDNNLDCMLITLCFLLYLFKLCVDIIIIIIIMCYMFIVHDLVLLRDSQYPCITFGLLNNMHAQVGREKKLLLR